MRRLSANSRPAAIGFFSSASPTSLRARVAKHDVAGWAFGEPCAPEESARRVRWPVPPHDSVCIRGGNIVNSKRRIGCLVLGVLSILAPGGLVAAEELWVAPTHVVPPGVTVFPWPTSGTGLASFGFAIPDDFEALDSVKVVLIPTANVTGSFNVYGASSEMEKLRERGWSRSSRSRQSSIAKTISEIDVTGLLATEIDPSSAGTDYVSVHFTFPASPGLEKATVLGLRFVYEAVSVATADIESGAVTNAKLADGSVGSAKVANNSLVSEDIQNQSLTGLDIADASLGSADVNLTQIQGRVSGNCPAGQASFHRSGGHRDLRVRLRRDGHRHFEHHTCNGSTVCSRTVDCDSNDRITGGGARLDEIIHLWNIQCASIWSSPIRTAIPPGPLLSSTTTLLRRLLCVRALPEPSAVRSAAATEGGPMTRHRGPAAVSAESSAAYGVRGCRAARSALNGSLFTSSMIRA